MESNLKKAKAFLLRHSRDLARTIMDGKSSSLLMKGKYPFGCENELQRILILLPDVEQVVIEEEGIRIMFR